MRMMTGAIMILAHVLLFGVYELGGWGERDRRVWMEYYSFALAGIGWAFVVWGFYLDVVAERHRRRRRTKKGDL